MGAIRILTEKVAAQIAAGEVIERPASVVRELVDNSIDAGAEKITARIKAGGRSLIRVADNGTGMDRDDLLLCLERHSTSKIKTVADLFSIKTLGFRGEALPSIASVSRMEIVSRAADQLIGHKLKVAGGALKSIEETGAPAGTSVEVRDLFYNTPARRKFLRAINTETAHIIDTVLRVALPYTDIYFRLEEGERILLNLPPSKNLSNRLVTVFGRNVAGALIEGARGFEGFQIKAYLAPPDLSRSRGDRIFIYVNGRNVRDRYLSSAIMAGYGQRLMKGRYPQALVFIEIAPSMVDVNVHPTKQEVRFHQNRLVYQALSSTVERALRRTLKLPFDRTGQVYEGTPGTLETEGFTHVIAEPGKAYLGARQVEDLQDVQSRGKIQEVVPLRTTSRVLGQLKNTYILCESREGLILIDQHAAHERIVYEKLRKSYEEKRVESQPFLIAPRLEFSHKETRLLMGKLDQLRNIGIEMEHFGGNTFLLRSVPSVLVGAEWESFIGELIPLLEEEKDLSAEAGLSKVWTVMACHGAVRAGHPLSETEMSSILDQLEDLNLPTNCPHGRPVFKKFTYYEIEKMFKRVV